MGKSFARKLREYYLFSRRALATRNKPVYDSGKQIPPDVNHRKKRKHLRL